MYWQLITELLSRSHDEYEYLNEYVCPHRPTICSTVGPSVTICLPDSCCLVYDLPCFSQSGWLRYIFIGFHYWLAYLIFVCVSHRCAQGDVVTHTAWLNRSSILYAGEEKWSVDPRVSLVTLNQEEFTIKIENVDMTDEGQYVCAVQTSSRPRTTVVHVLVQGNKVFSV